MGEGGWWCVVGGRWLVLSVGTATQQDGHPTIWGTGCYDLGADPVRHAPTRPERPDPTRPRQIGSLSHSDYGGLNSIGSFTTKSGGHVEKLPRHLGAECGE